MTTKRPKSAEAHLKKGNHSQQLKKYAKKIKGMEGIIKGSSVHKIFLRTEEIVKDKLLYLHEETKPDGHTAFNGKSWSWSLLWRDQDQEHSAQP